MFRSCSYTDTGELATSGQTVWQGWGTPAAPATPAALALESVAQFEQILPLPELQAWPALDKQVVGVETWFHIGTYREFRHDPPGLPVGIHLVATPERAEFVIDGKVVKTCTDAGRVWESGFREGVDTTTCGYRNHQSTGGSSSPMTVRVAYRISWSASTGESGVIDQPVVRSRTLPIVVRGYEAVIR